MVEILLEFFFSDNNKIKLKFSNKKISRKTQSDYKLCTFKLSLDQKRNKKKPDIRKYLN